jgi:hypothetical protein
MKLLIHLIKKDAAALGKLWFFWVLIVVAQVGGAIALTLPITQDMGAYLYVQGYFYALGAGWMLAAYLLTGVLILQDPPSGTKIFWATRPISGGMLLRAKLVEILLFLVIVPAVVWLPWRIASGFGAFDLVSASIHTMELAFFAVVPAIIIATISGDGRRFMLYNVVGLVAAFTLGMVLALRTDREPHGLVVTRLWIGVLITAAFAAVAVVAQYRTRLRARAATRLLSGIVLGSVTAAFFPFDGSAAFESRPRTVEFGDLVTFDAHLVPIMPKWDGEGGREFRMNIKVNGAPLNVALAPGAADIELSWPDGTQFVARGIGLRTDGNSSATYAVADALGLPVWTADAESWAKEFSDFNAHLKKLGRAPLEKPWPMNVRDLGYWTDFSIDHAAALKFESGAPTYTIKLKARFKSPEVMFQTPMVTNASGSGGGISARVLSAAEVTMPSRIFNEKNTRTLYGAWIEKEHAADADTRLYGIVSGIPGGIQDFEGSVMDFVDSNVAFEPMDRMHVSILYPKVWRNNRWVEVIAKGRTYTLVGIRFHEVGGLERTLHLDTITAPSP